MTLADSRHEGQCSAKSRLYYVHVFTIYFIYPNEGKHDTCRQSPWGQHSAKSRLATESWFRPQS